MILQPDMPIWTDNPDTMELVALTLTPISKSEMKPDGISFTTEYPKANETTVITAIVGNHGLAPINNPMVDFCM